MFPSDIQDIIVSCFNNFIDLMNWRHTCSSYYRDYSANFYCSKLYSFIKTPKVLANEYTNLFILSNRTYIKELFVDTLINDANIRNLVNLELLKFEYTNYHKKLTQLGFLKFTNLKVLHMQSSKILNDYILLKLPNLTDLNCNACQYVTHNSLKTLTKLVKLECISIPKLKTSFVKNLTNLEYLYIDKAVENNKCHVISQLTKLKRLRIDHSGLKPSTAKLLPNLEYLDCQVHEYTDDHIMHLFNLKSITIGINTVITDLSFKNLTKLEYLNFGSNNVLISEDIFTKLIHLQSLYIGTLFDMSDSFLINCTNLEILDCGRNNTLTDLCLSYLPNLKELYCAKNQNFTDNGVKNLKNIEKLNCGTNKNLTDITLLSLPKLKELDCGYNRNFRDALSIIYRHCKFISYTFDPTETDTEFLDIFKTLKF